MPKRRSNSARESPLSYPDAFGHDAAVLALPVIAQVVELAPEAMAPVAVVLVVDALLELPLARAVLESAECWPTCAAAGAATAINGSAAMIRMTMRLLW